MNWLLQQDIALFQWVNQGWRNSVLDTFMPLMSGNRFFMPCAILVGLLLVWRGRLRGFLCLTVLLLAIAFGDGVVYSSIKEAVSRPRPDLLVEAAGISASASRSSSMPSAHAGNWMCCVVVVFAFYRRSVWITLPLALLVGVSRIYNGAHYPGDVLAGMILGGGCGAAMLYVVDRGWAFAGRRCFPLWWEKMPTLPVWWELKKARQTEDDPEEEEPQFRPRNATGMVPVRHDSIDVHWLRLGYLLIGVTLLVRLIFLAEGPLQLSPDEAYQWHWSKHLALSYYSKPPMIALAQWVGTSLWGDNEFGVRFLSPVIAAGLGLMLLRFFAREVNARAGFFLLLILTTTPMLAAGAILMTVDPLSVFFWTAAMLAGWKAVRERSTLGDWACVGLWMGLGFLSKYTALFQLLCWAVFFWLWPAARKQLRRPGPWLALLIMGVCSLPVLLWNYQHDWITVAHVAEDAGAGSTWKPTAKYFLEFIGGQLGLLNPVFFVATVWASISFWKRARNNPKLVFFFSMGAPLFLVYLSWSFKSRVQPNWVAPSIIPLFCLAVVYWDARLRLGQTRVKSWLFAGLLFGAVAVLFAHDTDLLRKGFHVRLPPRLDPLRRVRAWPETGRLANSLRERVQSEGEEVFVIGNNYGLTAELSFYMPGSREVVGTKPFVYCLKEPTPRNQFDLWPGYEDRVGQSAIFVREVRADTSRTYPPPPRLVREFESVEEVGVRPVFERHRDEPTRQLQMFICRGLRP